MVFTCSPGFQVNKKFTATRGEFIYPFCGYHALSSYFYVLASGRLRASVSAGSKPDKDLSIVKIAIIGGGISGLTAAYYLSRKHDVTVLEQNDYIGGHTHTIDVEVPSGRYAVDTGFIVFNYRTYPNFNRMLRELGVGDQPSCMSFSVTCERTGYEYRGAELSGLFAQRKNLLSPNHWRFLSEVLRFNRVAAGIVDTLPDDLTVGDFFKQHPFSQAFIDYYFFPMGSAVWSCPHDTFASFPVKSIIDFYRNHGLLSVREQPQWYVVRGGSHQYVKAMLKLFGDRVEANQRVQAVERTAHDVAVRTVDATRRFDHVIFACHSDQALRMLGDDATPVERELLNAFPYEANSVVLHTDTNLLPKSRRAWAAWNYLLPKGEQTKATVTYNMNILQGIKSPEVFSVTLNSDDRIDPQKVLGRYSYHHPVFTPARAAAQRRHRELIDQRRSSFCGAYWGHGFHEDGVNSALAVCRVLEPDVCKAVSMKDGYATGDSPRETIASATVCS